MRFLARFYFFIFCSICGYAYYAHDVIVWLHALCKPGVFFLSFLLSVEMSALKTTAIVFGFYSPGK